MPFFLDTQETTERFGKQMAELCSFLDTNHVRHGSPDDLFEFAKTLEHSNQFRIDLSALVKSIFQKEHEELLLTDMMSIIAASVGGPSFADTNADLTGPTNSLMEFLLGTGCWRQFGSPPPPARTAAPSPPPRSSSRIEEPRPEPRPARTSVPTAPGESRESRFGNQSGNQSRDRSSLLDASSELRQTLSRLEINTLEVKLHLESIEQRISKIEPSDASPPSASTVESSPVPSVSPVSSPAPEPPQAQAQIQETPIPIAHPSAPDTSPRPHEPLPPEPILRPRTAASQYPPESVPAFGVDQPARRAMFSRHLVEPEPEEDDFPFPTFAYAAEKGRSNTPIGVFLVLVAVVAAFFFFGRSPQGKALLQTGMSYFKDARSLFDNAPGEAGNEPTTIPPTTRPQSVPAPAPASSGTPPETKSPSPAVPATTSAPLAEAAPAQPAAVSGEAAGDSNAATDTRSTSDIHKFQYVQSNVMRSRLLSAPDPEDVLLPDGGSMRGTVALQIVVSKSGSVETVRAIKGPEPLRSVAISAVRNWRYRPYTVDGRPVDVATTVYINFP